MKPSADVVVGFVYRLTGAPVVCVVIALSVYIVNLPRPQVLMSEDQSRA